MNVEFTRHAQQRMPGRRITESEVMVVLQWPDSTRTDQANNSVVYTATVERRTVSVAAVFPGTAADPVVVKTVWA